MGILILPLTSPGSHILLTPNSSMQKSSVFSTQLVLQHHATPPTAADEEPFHSSKNRGISTNKCILFAPPFSCIQALHTYYSLHCLSIIIKI